METKGREGVTDGAREEGRGRGKERGRGRGEGEGGRARALGFGPFSTLLTDG